MKVIQHKFKNKLYIFLTSYLLNISIICLNKIVICIDFDIFKVFGTKIAML